MSLIDFTRFASSLIDAAFDKPPFDVRGALRAPPLTKNYGMVGTAFDYAIRLQIANLNRNLVQEFPLVASHGIRGDTKRESFVSSFHRRREAFLGGELTLYNLVPDCIVLAKMEAGFRSGRNLPNSDIFHVDEDDLQDLRNLMELVEAKSFTAIRQCVLNPTFAQSSGDVGGADADLILDGVLIDFKTTKTPNFERAHFRQLMGYYILNEREQRMHGELARLGIYFSRFGMLYTFPIPKLNRVTEAGKELNVWQEMELRIREYNDLLNRE